VRSRSRRRPAAVQATLRGIAEDDVDAVNGWISLETWYRPAVAAWTREPAVLREIQANATIRAALAALGSTTATTHWLSQLIETVFRRPVRGARARARRGVGVPARTAWSIWGS